MLDKESLAYLETIYERDVITVAETNRLTGYDEGVSNPVTGMLLRNRYIEYVLGEYMMNTDGQWVDIDSSFRITPEGRAYVENTLKQNVAEQDAKTKAKNRKAKRKQILIKLIEVVILPLILGVALILIEKLCFSDSDTGIDTPKQGYTEEYPVNNPHD